MAVVFILSGMLLAPGVLAATYFCLCILALQRLMWLEATTKAEMNTKKLFVMTCFLVVTLRFMSFTFITVLNLQNSWSLFAHSTGTGDAVDNAAGPTGSAPSRTLHLRGLQNTSPVPADSDFEVLFDKANLVLFDLPDFCCVSAYMLLLVVWAEAFLKSRRHWLSTAAFRRVWLWGYLAFNTALYSVQFTLYSMLFWPAVDQASLSFWISLALTSINLCLPLIWLLGFLYLSFVLGGFPLSSSAAKLRLSKLSTVGTAWTLSRCCWGLLALSSTLQGWLVETAAQQGGALYSILLVSARCLCCTLLSVSVPPFLTPCTPPPPPTRWSSFSSRRFCPSRCPYRSPPSSPSQRPCAHRASPSARA